MLRTPRELALKFRLNSSLEARPCLRARTRLAVSLLTHLRASQSATTATERLLSIRLWGEFRDRRYQSTRIHPSFPNNSFTVAEKTAVISNVVQIKQES